MQKTTKDRGLMGAFLAAVVVAAVMLLLAGGLILCYFGGEPDRIAAGAVVLTALIYLAVAVGVIVALVQRWREIRGGEEEDARKY